MVYYVLKSALLLTLLYGGFSVFLSRETFHRFNRVVLVVIMLVSMALPAVHITTERPTPVTLEQYWEPMLQNMETQAPSPASVAGNAGAPARTNLTNDYETTTFDLSTPAGARRHHGAERPGEQACAGHAHGLH
jgi:hypothetical protein